MGEPNRRAVEAEGMPGEADTTRVGHATRIPDRDPDDNPALGAEADERQTRRQAPDSAGPGEGGEDDSIG
ncbi:MAG: hypothetical protein JNL41_01700 [Phenylobacterium sp.]|uniref:hypothetical protein n=1 Tax=Phenylobacterium sp. TaxID=1871053 RepID=UPI001A5DABE4|nr:hypothetical protein [Phenylobacterium sp.]MBL8552962.1 hypothetical protein [Phenylobacterium sp.]